jgi:hypothetical protein
MKQEEILKRIMEGIERISPKPSPQPNFFQEESFVWNTDPNRFEVVSNQHVVNPNILVGIDQVKDLLMENTNQFSQGFSANNALLWGARGMGKSTLIKAVHSIYKSKKP